MMIGCHPEGVSPKDLKILRYAQNDKHIIREIQYTSCGGIFPFLQEEYKRSTA